MNIKKSKDLKAVFPIKAVENDCLISGYGDITVGFELDLPEIYTLNAVINGHGENQVETGDFRELVEIWSKAINVLPVNSILHKQDWFVEEKYEPSYSSNTFLDKASEKHFNERPYLYHRCYLFLTKTHTERNEISATRSTLARGRIIPKEISDRSKREEFFNAVEHFHSIIDSSRKIKMRRLKTDDLVGTSTSPGILERYMSLSLRDEVVTLADIEMGEELRIGGKFSKYFTLSDVDDMPEYVYTNNKVDGLSTENSCISVGFASPVGLMLHCNHIYNQYIFIGDKETIFPQLEQRATQMQSLASFSKKNEVNSELIHKYIRYAAETGYAPVRTHFNIQVWSEDKAQLPVLRHMVSSAVSKIGVRPRENSQDTPLLFWAGIPGNAADLPKEDRFWTYIPQAVCLLNMESNNNGTESTFGVKLVERLSGKPIYVDLSDLPMLKGIVGNRNKFIIGPSGSGKSFFINLLLRSYYTHGAHIVLVDIGNSYEGLSQLVGGKYLTYREEAPIAFNPFYVEGRSRPTEQKTKSLEALLLSLWKKEEESLTRLEETALSKAVSGYYDYLQVHEEVFPCFNSFYDYLSTDFKTWLVQESIGDKHFDYQAFMIVLRPYSEGGEYDYLLNSTTTLDLTYDRFIVFELDNIKDHNILLPVVTIIIMDTFITKMSQLPIEIRKIILIEEAWKAIMKAEMAGFIQYLYKTVRKYFGEAWIITQEVDDLINSPVVKDAIINNADTKILLDQRKYQNKFDIVKKFLALTDSERNLALSLNRDLDPKRKYREVLIAQGGQQAKVYGVEVSTEEYFTYTTEGPEKGAIKKLVASNGGDFELAIRDHVETVKSSRV